ncbi:MAG: hypothetical protein IKB07_02665 [Lachnospiraceae bacterium]|nr:hypothetical protein [Lachnospiraceae bacterium]
MGEKGQTERRVIIIGRMSARYIGQKIGMSPKGVYDILEAMGLVQKDNMGDWTLTVLGREMGGRMSEGSRLSVPTFDFDTIISPMVDFWKKKKA